MNTFIIKCLQCGADISVDDALTHQIEDGLKADLKKEQAKLQLALAEKEKVLVNQTEDLARARETVHQQVASELEKQKIVLMAEARKKAQAESGGELELLKEEMKEKEKKLEFARQMELQMRREKNELEEKKREFEIEKQRQMDQERERIRTEAMQVVEEQHRLKDAEKDKKLQDALKSNEEMNRKLLQGSQQTQGEVQELELENLLRATFIYDEIIPVGKGINGADVVQKVRDRSGRECGTIVWESKQTKAWSDGWIPKLKDDQRSAKAEAAILVSQALHSNVKNFGQVEGVWVTNFDCVVPVANAIRSTLVQVAIAKSSVLGKNEKMEVVYNYLCGTEFKQKIEAIVETFGTMKLDLDRERRAMQKMWATREKQIERIVDNTSQMYGDLQGLIGTSMPAIAALDLPLIEIELSEEKLPSQKNEMKEIKGEPLF